MSEMRVVSVTGGGLYVIVEAWDTMRDGSIDVRTQRTYVETAEAVLNEPRFEVAWAKFLAKHQ
jgi:hypothetical protein